MKITMQLTFEIEADGIPQAVIQTAGRTIIDLSPVHCSIFPTPTPGAGYIAPIASSDDRLADIAERQIAAIERVTGRLPKREPWEEGGDEPG